MDSLRTDHQAHRVPHAVLRGRGQPREAAQPPALFSAGLADDITPPSTVFAAFNHYAGPKDIAVYEFNGHEGGGTRHLRAKLDFLAATLSG
jgi:cephalosporin-C deacetylase-like acetyl esterase